MEQAERQLLQLLRGQDAAEFTLQITLKREHSDPSRGRGGHLLRNLVWTITMSVAQVKGARTTSGASFAQAWQRQNLWWRSAPGVAKAPGRPDFGHATSTDTAERAELQFLTIVRGDVGGELATTVSVKAGRWTTKLLVPRTAREGATGEGTSFAYAWYHDWPWWQNKPLDFGARR
jgi:hypothetical protein